MKIKNILPIVLFALLLFVAPTQASIGMWKGAHIASDTNVAKFDLLANDMWMGDDTVIGDLNTGQNLAVYSSIQAEFIMRVPFNINGNTINNIKQLSNFHCKFELLNEPDLAGYTPTYAAQLVSNAIAIIDTNCQNAYIILQMPSQYYFDSYAPQLWSALTPAVKTRLNGISYHFYPPPAYLPDGKLDTTETVRRVHEYSRWTFRVWMNENGITLPAYLTETGLTEDQVTARGTRYYVEPLWDDLEQFTWLYGVFWFAARTNLGYRQLILDDQSGLTGAGIEWGTIQ